MMAMKIFRKRITYKTAAILLFIFLFFTVGTIYLILSARENKTTSGVTPTATESASAEESTSSAQPTTDSITDTASDTSKESSSNGDPELEEESAPITLPPSGNTVTITASGFSPSTITISVGEMVMWVNNDIKNHWPASDPHPQHTDYSGFDSLGISSGSSWSFKFNATGTWNYHDHNLPTRKGTVVVQ